MLAFATERCFYYSTVRITRFTQPYSPKIWHGAGRQADAMVADWVLQGCVMTVWVELSARKRSVCQQLPLFPLVT